MSSKTVKVTNGKILNYTITADGYKTIHGSKLITSDTTISNNMTPEISTDGVYSLGDRIGNVASFVCYYTDGDGQKYAVFVADAQYRVGGITWGLQQEVNVEHITSNPQLEQNCTKSATYNTNYIINTYYPSGTTSNPFPAFKAVRDSVRISSLGQIGLAQVPNAFELNSIYQLKTALDSYDPTLQHYPNNSLTTWNINGNSSGYCWSSNVPNDMQYAWRINSLGNWSYNGGRDDYGFRSTYTYGFIPVFEIPVN